MLLMIIGLYITKKDEKGIYIYNTLPQYKAKLTDNNPLKLWIYSDNQKLLNTQMA